MAKKRIGTDLSLAQCREEGYLTMLVDSVDLKQFDPKKEFCFGRCLPAHVDSNPFRRYFTGFYSADDLWEFYSIKKEQVDRFCGLKDGERVFPADVYDLLALASDLDSYRGIIDFHPFYF